MKKILFSGFIMITSVIGLSVIIHSAITASDVFGSINGSSDLFTYLDWFKLTPLYYVFLLLGAFGIALGLWGLFDRDK